jgi:uncharacterized protein YukE
MLVNPELLKGFASQVDSASAAIKSADVGHVASTSADGLQGSTTQWAMRLVGDHMTSQVNAIAKNVADMGTAVRGAANKYEVSDDALASTFDGIFG